MGVWAKIGGYAMMAGGVIAAPYTGGASLALVPAGAAVVAGDQKKDAAKKAQTEQNSALTQAIGTQTAARDQAVQAYSPYTGMGQEAVGALNDYMGYSPPTLGGVGGPTTAWGTSMGNGVVPGGVSPTPLVSSPYQKHTPTENSEVTGAAVPRDAMGTPVPQARASYQTASSYTPTLGNAAGGFVKLRAPNGSVKLVPREQAAHYAERGAVEVA